MRSYGPEVTNPDLLNQLEGNEQTAQSVAPAKAPSFGNEITDPKLIAQLESEQPAQQLLGQVQSQQESAPRAFQQQEVFSNPTQIPGFSSLPKEEQLQRIALSAVDPANQNALGSFVPPGTYENPAVRMAASIAPTLMQPELGIGQGLLARYAINPLLNTAARIGVGTAGNIGYQLPDIKNMQDLKDVAQSSLGLNALLEAGTIPFRAANYAAEMFNPMQFASNKAQQIQNEYKTAKAMQQERYKSALQPFKGQIITDDPENYFGFNKQQLQYFSPEMTRTYNDFLDKPTAQNLHTFQSQAGKDSAAAARNRNLTSTAQARGQVRDIAKNKLLDVLSPNEKAFNDYNEGSNITRDLVEPYRTNALLRKITSGVKQNPSPTELSNAIKQGTEKVIYEKKGVPVTAITNDHPLINHLNDLNRMTNFGNLAQSVSPFATGALTGELISPGLGGALAGSLANGLISNAAAKFGGKMVAPMMTGVVQNPLLQSWMKKIAPLYYAGGRAAIGTQQ